MVTKNEFAKLTGRSLPQVRKLCDKGTFSVPGFGTFRAVKSGSSKTAPIDIQMVGSSAPPPIQEDPEPVKKRLEISSLKTAKTAIEIQLLKQRLNETQESIENNFRADTVNALLSILEPLKTAFRECKLTTEQKNILDDAINESLERCKQHLSL